MTNEEKEECIGRWVTIINCVFKAEDAIRGDWEQRLRDARSSDQSTKEKVANDYTRAIAEEILGNYFRGGFE